jgi:hypothetical protein
MNVAEAVKRKILQRIVCEAAGISPIKFSLCSAESAQKAKAATNYTNYHECVWPRKEAHGRHGKKPATNYTN